MKLQNHGCGSSSRQCYDWLTACLLTLMLWPAQAHASMFKGEALDQAAKVPTWIVLVVVPTLDQRPVATLGRFAPSFPVDAGRATDSVIL
jgi:hypothetical protein